MNWFTRTACGRGTRVNRAGLLRLLPLLLWVLYCPSPSQLAAQAPTAAAVSFGPVMTPFETIAANAPYRVCAITTTGVPCSTAGVSLFSDPNLTQPLPNPGAANTQGIISFFVAQGNYVMQVTPLPGETYVYNFILSAGGGGGSVGPGTVGFIPKFATATTINNSHIDDSATTASTVTITEPVVVNSGGSTAGWFDVIAGTDPGGATGHARFTSDSTNGYAEVNENNTGRSRVCTAANGICQPPTTFQTGGVNNSSQTTLNLVAGTNVTITNTSGGNVTIAASGGGGSGAITNVTSSVTWTNCTVTGNVCSTTGSVASVTAASLNTACTGNSLEFDIVPIDAASGQFAFSMELNADATSGDYVGNGNTLAGTTYTGVTGGMRIGVIGDSTTGGQATVHILNFGSSLPKNWYSTTQSNTTSTAAMQDFQGTWFKSGNPAITSVVFLDPTPNNLASGSTFIAYCVN